MVRDLCSPSHKGGSLYGHAVGGRRACLSRRRFRMMACSRATIVLSPRMSSFLEWRTGQVSVGHDVERRMKEGQVGQRTDNGKRPHHLYVRSSTVHRPANQETRGRRPLVSAVYTHRDHRHQKAYIGYQQSKYEEPTYHGTRHRKWPWRHCARQCQRTRSRRGTRITARAGPASSAGCRRARTATTGSRRTCANPLSQIETRMKKGAPTHLPL